MQIITTRNFKSISQQKIELSDIEYIVRKSLGEKATLKSVQTTKQGDVNSSYILNTETPATKLFLKVEDSVNIPRFYSGQIEREIEGTKLCTSAKIPCAKIIGFDTSCKDIGKKYILTEFIESDLLSDRWNSLNPGQKLDVKKDMLCIVNKMQSIKSSWFGDIYENGSIGKYPNWPQALQLLIDIASNDCLCLGTLSLEEVKLIKEAANACLQKLKPDYTASFNHMDIHWHNVFISEYAGIVEIRGIIDFGSSLYAPAFSDEYRLNSGFLYGTEEFFNNHMKRNYALDEHEEFSCKLLSMLDYYVFLSIIGETGGTRERIIKNCEKYLGLCRVFE